MNNSENPDKVELPSLSLTRRAIIKDDGRHLYFYEALQPVENAATSGSRRATAPDGNDPDKLEPGHALNV